MPFPLPGFLDAHVVGMKGEVALGQVLRPGDLYVNPGAAS
jgi:hypothetical protein